MPYVNNLLQLIASGTILYFGIAALAGVVVYLLVKFPTLWNLVTWPVRVVVRPLWNKVLSTKWGTRAKGWVTATSAWTWLESKQYDPPAHPLSWWVSRGLVVLWFVVVGTSMAFWHGHNLGLAEAVPQGYATKMRAIAFAWRDRAQSCESTQAALTLPAPTPSAVVTTVAPPLDKTKGKTKRAPKPWYGALGF